MAINRDFASPSRNSKTKIRRPINAFLLYCNENRPQFKEENPGVKHVHISKILAIQWKCLPPERKNEYLEMARAIKKSHGIANPEYRYCPKEVRLKLVARREARKRKTKDKVVENQTQNESENHSERPRNLTSLLTALNPTLKPSEIQSLRLALMSQLGSILRNESNSSSHSTETARNMRAMNENSSDSSLDRQTTNVNQKSDEKDVNKLVNKTNQSEESYGPIDRWVDH